MELALTMTNIDSNNLLSEAIASIITPVIERAVREAIGAQKNEDRLLDAEEASTFLAVSQDWLYRHANKLPFTRKLGPKTLRFSYQGLQKYLAQKMRIDI